MVPTSSDGDKIICGLHQIPLEESANRLVRHKVMSAWLAIGKTAR
jgi:hypothetical protein